MKTLLTTLVLITVSLAATDTASAQVTSDLTIGSGNSGISGLWLPENPNETLANANLAGAAEYELALLYAALEKLEAELAILLRQAPSSRNFRTYREYQNAHDEWLNEIDKLMLEIRIVERQIDYWISFLEMYS